MLGVALQWTSIPSRGVWKYCQSLHATDTRIQLQPDEPLGSYRLNHSPVSAGSYLVISSLFQALGSWEQAKTNEEKTRED